jgi:streptomycin 3"-adenylyltransferase
MTPEVNSEQLAYCVEAVRRIREVVGSDLIGAYLHGSLALGDFHHERSDIDLLAVTARAVVADLKPLLCKALSPSSLPCPAVGLEFSLVTRGSLRCGDTAPNFELHIATDTKTGTERCIDGTGRAGDTDLVMHYAVLRSRGVTLVGPEPVEVFPEVRRDHLLDALRGELEWAMTNGSPSYQVLNAARAWRFLEDDVICSKTEGGEWARVRHDRSAIDAALGHRRGNTDAQPNHAEAVEFVRAIEQRLAATSERQATTET